MVNSPQRVVVTAAADGIGRRIAEVFLEAGARVLACDVDASGLESLRRAWPAVAVSTTDVADESAVAVLFELANASLGGLDVLVNTAGIAGPVQTVEAIRTSDWRRCLDVNLTAAFLCSRLAIPLLKRNQGGAIVNFTSTVVVRPCTRRSPYVTAKWAVIGLTKALAAELGPHGIRVNAIAPGAVEGARMERVIRLEAEQAGVPAEEIRRRVEAEHAMGSFVTADDVAQVVHFLCSDRARRVSGQVIGVDGFTL
jgi:NAD(P)-dependent dehydrogenase (short-subunit alcohol dehydrogenase family)